MAAVGYPSEWNGATLVRMGLGGAMKSRLYVAAAVAALSFMPANAEECGKLISFGDVPLTHFEGEPSEFVPVEIAGVPKLMMLDTGAGFTTITSAVAKELHLNLGVTNFQAYDLTGAMANQRVTAPVKIGELRGSSLNFMLSPASLDFADSRVAGLLGADVLRNFDVSIDYGTHTFTLLSQNHCDGQVVFWPERPLAIIPFKLEQGYHIILPVKLDGEEFNAILDTGAAGTTLEKKKALRNFDLVLGSADTPVSGNLNGREGLTTWTHRFKSLSLAGIETANPEVTIIPDKMSQHMNTWSTGSLLDQKANGNVDPAPMLLGMNVLKHLHIYIAYKERKLYITPAGGQDAKAAAPAKTN
jgi:predicted aspartyl protease